MTYRQNQCPESFLDHEAFADLEKAGNVKLSVAQRSELNDEISYIIRLRDWHEAYSPEAIKARARVAKLGRELKRKLSALDKPAYLSVVLSDDEGQVHFMEPSLSSADPQQFMEQLDAIIERGDWKAPDGGGTAAIGGDRTGPFADFICRLNDHIPQGYRAGSGDQLAKHAQNALRRLKTQRERAARAQAFSPQKSPQ